MKKITKICLMLFVIIIGIGGACFADKETNLKCKYSDLICNKNYIWVTLDDEYCQLQCESGTFLHWETTEPQRHQFTKDALKCDNCDYECKYRTKARYMIENGTEISEIYHRNMCTNAKHIHQIQYKLEEHKFVLKYVGGTAQYACDCSVTEKELSSNANNQTSDNKEDIKEEVKYGKQEIDNNKDNDDDPPVNPNPCSQCGKSVDVTTWKDDGQGNHYQACPNGHKINNVGHWDVNEDLICDHCKLPITTCYVCKGKLKDGYKDNGDGKHYKECVNGHLSYGKEHVDNGNGGCKDCQYSSQMNIVYNVDTAGNLTITMTHKTFVLNSINSVRITDEASTNNILFIDNIKLKELATSGKEKIFAISGNELKVMEGKIELTVKPGTALGNKFIDKNLTINVEVNLINSTDNTNKLEKGTGIILWNSVAASTLTGFTDVEDNRWTMKSIDYVVKKNIMNGIGDNLFNPTGKVTRQELAVIIKRIIDERKNKLIEQTVTYTDINQCGSWAVDAVKLVGPYITSGTTFEPTKEATKAEVINALVKVFGLEGKITVSEETKAKVQLAKTEENLTDSELEKALGILIQAGVISKDDQGKYNVNNNITREHLAHIIHAVYTNEVVKIKCSRTNCTGTIIEKWENDNKYHWRMCSNNHDVDKVAHEYNEYGKCKVCHFSKGASCTVCTTDTKAKWIVKESMHVLVCEKDNTHVMRIEGHVLDKNNICEVCGFLDTKEYPVKFKDFTDQKHWAWANVGHLAEMGIVKGVTNSGDSYVYLNGNDTVTAEAVIALLARILGYDGVDKIAEGTVYKPIVSSWSEGEWKFLMKYLTDKGRDAKAEMQVLLSNNGISGTDEEVKANYTKAISRERVAHLLGSFLKSNSRQEVLADNFEDWALVNDSYKETIKRLSAYDIFRGRSNNEILYVRPTEPITRVEAIALIDRFNTVQELGITYGQ